MSHNTKQDRNAYKSCYSVVAYKGVLQICKILQKFFLLFQNRFIF